MMKGGLLVHELHSSTQVLKLLVFSTTAPCPIRASRPFCTPVSQDDDDLAPVPNPRTAPRHSQSHHHQHKRCSNEHVRCGHVDVVRAAVWFFPAQSAKQQHTFLTAQPV